MKGEVEAVDEAAKTSISPSTSTRGYGATSSGQGSNPGPVVTDEDKVEGLTNPKHLSRQRTNSSIIVLRHEEKPSLPLPAPGSQRRAGESPPPSPPPSLPLIREVLFVAIVCLAQLCTQISFGQVLFILPIIGENFFLRDDSELSWLVAGYSLTVGTFILISGRFGDVFGYKRMLVIGYSWFALWTMVSLLKPSLKPPKPMTRDYVVRNGVIQLGRFERLTSENQIQVCGLSVFSNHVLFIFARVLQGIGPAIILPNGLALIGAFYPPGPRKNMAFALFGACAPGTLTQEKGKSPPNSKALKHQKKRTRTFFH